MFRLRLHPTPFGTALGVLVVALWAMLWLVFFVEVSRIAARQPGEVPELARVVTAGDWLS